MKAALGLLARTIASTLALTLRHQKVQEIMRRTALVLAIALSLSASGLADTVSYSSTARSAPSIGADTKQYPKEIITTEMMMDAQGTLMAALALLYGPDVNSVLHFSSYVDAANRSYSFRTDDGSSYLGQPFSFLGSGRFSGGQWSFDGGGEFAGETAEDHGKSVTVPEEDSPDAGKSEWKVKFGGQELIFEADVEYYDPYPEIPNLFHLRSKGTFRLKGTDSTFKGTDVQNADGTWTWTLVVSSAAHGDFRIDSQGLRSDTGIGNFDVAFTPVPEPSTISLFASSVLLMIARRARRTTDRQCD